MSGHELLPGGEPDVDLDRLPYLLQVEADLVAAARRQPVPGRRGRRPDLTAATAVATVVTLVALLGGLLGGTSLRPAAALRFTVEGDDLVIDVEPDLPPIHTDPVRLTQVLVNLANNAAKFTQGGNVALSARRSSRDGNE